MAKRNAKKGPNMKQLKALAAEMNEVMELDPVLDPDADELDEDGLIEAIKDEAYDPNNGECVIYTTDEFSKAALKTLAALDIEPVEPPDGGDDDPVKDDEDPDKGKTGKTAKKPAGKTKPPTSKPKPPPKPKFTRIDAVVKAIHKNKKKLKPLEDLAASADDIYVNEGGASNEKETRWALNHTIKVLVAWDAVEVEDGKLQVL